MSKKFIVAALCLIIAIISFISDRENDSLFEAGEMLISALSESPAAVQVFNMDKGVFV